MHAETIQHRIDSDCDAWDVEQEVRDTAKGYVKEIERFQAFEDKPYEVISAGCIFTASRQCNLPRSFQDLSRSSGIPKKEIVSGTKGTTTYLHELGLFFRDTAPITLSFAFQNIVQAFSIFTCGKLGTFELSVASYGYMFFSATAAMIAIGGSTAIDTLCSQAFTSRYAAENKAYLGVVLQRGLIFLTLFFFVVIAPIWWHASTLFQRLGQAKEFSIATEVFLKHMLPAGLAQVIAECFKKFLQVQNHSTAVGWCIGAAAVVGALANYVLILKTSLGVNGAAIAHAIYHGATIVAMAVFVASNKSARTYWGGFSRKAFAELGSFVFLACTGILTVATEFWCFETIALMAATLDPASVGAQSIVMTSDLIFATVPLGLSVASSHRIGKSLGAGEGQLARFQARIPYLVAVIIGLVECVILLSVRNLYGRIFSQDQDVVNTTAKVLPILAVFQCLDISNGGAAGILRGAAKTHLAGACNIFGYYAVGLVLAWAFCFKLGFGLFGLWAGLVCGSAALLLLQTGCILVIKWDKEADAVVARAAERAENERAPLLENAD